MSRILIIFLIAMVLIMIFGKISGMVIQRFSRTERNSINNRNKNKSPFDRSKMVDAEYEEVK